MFKERCYTEKDVEFLSLVTNINHGMDNLIDKVNDLNIMAMGIVAEKDPKSVTKEMIISMAKKGIDVRDINEEFADVLPDCFEVYREEDKTDRARTKAKTGKKISPKDSADSEIQPVAGAVPPSGIKKTGNVIHDDEKKRGVIFVKCNKDIDIETRVVDELIQAAIDRDIWIQEFIVNEKDGIDKLKSWIESGVIDYIIMNRLEEFSQSKITQFFFLDHAYHKGIKVLLKDNDYKPIFPD